jgi:hypothetical protein
VQVVAQVMAAGDDKGNPLVRLGENLYTLEMIIFPCFHQQTDHNKILASYLKMKGREQC